MAVILRDMDPRIPTMPGRSMSGFHRRGRHCLCQPRSTVRCSASYVEREEGGGSRVCNRMRLDRLLGLDV